jgi:hypothetical protein
MSKKIKLSPQEKRVLRKCTLIKNKLGKLEGAINVWNKNNERYFLVIRYEDKKKKKDKFKVLFSCPDLTFIQQIGDKLSEELKFAYNPKPEERTREAKKIKKEKSNLSSYIDKSIFKEYYDAYFIKLDFGIIVLENGKYHTKRHYEKMHGIKISDAKTNMNFNKCQDLLLTLKSDMQEKLIKDVFRLGGFDDANSVRVAMNQKPKKIAASPKDPSKFVQIDEDFSEKVLQEID